MPGSNRVTVCDEDSLAFGEGQYHDGSGVDFGKRARIRRHKQNQHERDIQLQPLRRSADLPAASHCVKPIKRPPPAE